MWGLVLGFMCVLFCLLFCLFVCFLVLKFITTWLERNEWGLNEGRQAVGPLSSPELGFCSGTFSEELFHCADIQGSLLRVNLPLWRSPSSSFPSSSFHWGRPCDFLRFLPNHLPGFCNKVPPGCCPWLLNIQITVTFSLSKETKHIDFRDWS